MMWVEWEREEKARGVWVVGVEKASVGDPCAWEVDEGF